MERFLGGQARGNELTEAIKKVNQQGFEQIYELLEKLTTLLHKSGYDITLGDDKPLIIGDNNQGNGAPNQTALRELQTEISRLILSVNSHKPSNADLSVIENRYRQHIKNWFETVDLPRYDADCTGNFITA